MARKEFRLIYGLIAIAGIYVAVNMVHQSLIEDGSSGQAKLSGQIARGQQLTENCTACHYLDQKANFVGPHLVGLIGRPVADVSDFEYSPAVRKLSGSWSEARLTEFLTAPQRYAPGTKMALQGWAAEDAKAIAAYFESRN